MKYSSTIFLVGLLVSVGLFGQQTHQTDGISLTYTIADKHLVCELKAETLGWVGVGFNTENSIVGSDLLLFNIVKGQASCVDLFVKSAGNPLPDEALGGKHTIELLDAEEKSSTTKVKFSIPLSSGDPFDFKHEMGKRFWLILAYSVADDFKHHSRVRRHIPITLKP